MKVTDTKLTDVKIIGNGCFRDHRGFLQKAIQKQNLRNMD